MPTLKRKPVSLVPLPEGIRNNTLPPDTEVFYLQATGEVFLDFQSYSDRISFYLQKIFSCEATGKNGMDYYTALNSERRERDVVNQRFPELLKGKVLKTIQYQVIGRLDTLIDLIWERYKDRYYAGETCTVDVSGDKYACQITAVFPPQVLRDRFHPTDASGEVDIFAAQDLSVETNNNLAHHLASNLNVSIDEVLASDPAEEYKYTVQLIGEGSKFQGSFTEATNKQLNRDRFCFSKSILKRYLKECVTRDTLVGSPWLVKPKLAQQFGLPMVQPADVAQRNKDIRDGALAKRKKISNDDYPTAKRQRSRAAAIKAEAAIVQEDEDPDPEPVPVKTTRQKATKYPVEDLGLDPMTVIDGRILRRTNGEIPELPAKPALSRDLPISKEHFDSFLHVWNTLNIFGWPLFLANFTMDDFEAALLHDKPDVPCALISEVHGCLITLVINENSRVPGTSSATATGGIPAFFEPSTVLAGEEPMSTAQKERFVRKGLEFSRKWDRSKRLNTANGRLGWEKYLIGCLCQRGAIETMPELPQILKHLFASQADSIMADPPDTAASELTALDASSEDAASEADADEEEAAGGPAEAYPTLPVQYKLAILSFLSEFVINSKAIRSYIDDCEAALTELRKDRIEVNRDRRTFLAEKAALETAAKSAPAEPEEAPVEDVKPAIPETPRDDASTMDMDELERSSVAPVERDEEVGSDVDELASTAGGSVREATPDTSFTSAAGSRQATLREKSLQKKAEVAAKSKNGSNRKGSKKGQKSTPAPSPPPPAPISDKQRIEEGLLQVQARDEQTEREFRRHQQVLRVRPLGKDRFFNRYWYFDGIGTMEMLSEEGTPVYGSGRLFVQGPSDQDWITAVELQGDTGEEGLKQRRSREEGSQEAVLDKNEWGYLTSEEDLDTLCNWLNSKGSREYSLKADLKEWRPYIVGGAKRRLKDLEKATEPREEVAPPASPAANGRKTRKSLPGKAEEVSLEHLPPYLRYVNNFAQVINSHKK